MYRSEAFVSISVVLIKDFNVLDIHMFIFRSPVRIPVRNFAAPEDWRLPVRRSRQSSIVKLVS